MWGEGNTASVSIQHEAEKHRGTRIRIVIADDHLEMHTQIREILGDEFEILDDVIDGSQAVRAVQTLNPDILLTDISMPILTGLQVTKAILGTNGHTKVVVMSIHEDPDLIAAALSAGALGYVTKRSMYSDLVFAVNEAMSGRSYVSKNPRGR